MEREKRKVGRPISMVREDKVRRNFSLQRKISDAIDEYAIKMNKTSSEVVEDFCSAGILAFNARSPDFPLNSLKNSEISFVTGEISGLIL